MPKIIQFLHPGTEHSDKSGIVWNSRSIHRRKFVSWKGNYIESLGNSPKKGEIDFWCEWEAESTLLEYKPKNGNNPKNLFSPYYSRYKKGEGCENTDPFVFGNQFYYCICRQPVLHSLKKLEKNSLILFGSNKGESFIIDTIFIVKSATKYSKKNYLHLKDMTNDAFMETAIMPVIFNTNDKNKDNRCSNDLNEEYVVYEALTYKDNPEFFSYVPAKLHSENWGFERPVIDFDDIGQSIKQSIKYINDSDVNEISEEEIKKLWKKITNKILNKDKLFLMTSCELPKQK